MQVNRYKVRGHLLSENSLLHALVQASRDAVHRGDGTLVTMGESPHTPSPSSSSW